MTMRVPSIHYTNFTLTTYIVNHRTDTFINHPTVLKRIFMRIPGILLHYTNFTLII